MAPFAVIVKVAGVYFPATPTGKVNDCAEAVKDFLSPKLLVTPSDIIILVIPGTPMILLNWLSVRRFELILKIPWVSTRSF